MRKRVHIVDFHAHLMTLAGAEEICPGEQKSPFFKYVVPVLEPIADITEPVHDQLLRRMAMHYRGDLSRFAYSKMGQLFLMEALRLFKRHGLERLLKSMDKFHIAHTVIYSLEPLTNTRDIVELTKPYSNRFSVFASVASAHHDPCGYLEPLMKEKLIRGVKIHPMIGHYIAHTLFEKTKDYIALASEYDLPVTIHTGDIPTGSLPELPECLAVDDLELIVKTFPKCKIVLNHMGWESWRKAIDMAKTYPNVYLETSWQPAKTIRRAVDALGPHRIIFGSDFPLFQQWQALEETLEALAPKEFQMVASSNALELLHLEAPAKV